MIRRLTLIAVCVATGASHPPLAGAADDPLPPGAALRLGDTRFLVGGPVERLEFSPDAKHLTAWAVPAGSREARLKTTWDAATWQPVRTTDDVQLVGAVVRWQPTSIPDSTRGVVVTLEGVAVVRDFETGKDVVRLTGHYSRVTAVAVSADGKRIATGAADGLVRVWDTATFRPLTEPKGHSAAVRRVEVSADGRTALTAGLDGTVRLWDLANGRELRAFPASGGVGAFSPDGAAVRLRDGERVVTRDLVTGLEIVPRSEPRGDPWLIPQWLLGQSGLCAAVSPDGRTVVVGRRSGEVELYEVVSCQVRRRLPGHAGGCFDATFTSGGRRLLTAGGDHSALVWGVRVQDVPLTAELRRETNAAKLWDRMTDGNAEAAYAAMARLAADPVAAVRMARLRLRAGLLSDPVAEVRAGELLEAIDTADSRAFLAELASGDPTATRTREARGALTRLRVK
jgi:WD40 repeat protein